MAANSSIEWTDSTWNPVRGCSRVSEGCRNCYAEVMAARFSGPGQWGEGFAAMKSGDHRWTGKVALIESHLDLPLRWQKPRKIFVNSTSDLFHESLSDEDIDKVFRVMEVGDYDWDGERWTRRPGHTYQILTKRSARARAYMIKRFAQKQAYADQFQKCPTPAMRDSPAARFARQEVCPTFWNNIWLGASVEDQERADERIPHLLATPVAVRFLSCEPLIGPMNLRRILTNRGWYDALEGWRDVKESPAPEGVVDWVIAGGESGPGSRPMHPAWARSLRDQCARVGVPFFFKQWGEWEGGAKTVADRERGASQFHKSAYHDFGDDYMALRVGKKLAGALLDGVEHKAFPAALAA